MNPRYVRGVANGRGTYAEARHRRSLGAVADVAYRSCSAAIGLPKAGHRFPSPENSLSEAVVEFG